MSPVFTCESTARPVAGLFLPVLGDNANEKILDSDWLTAVHFKCKTSAN